MSASQFDDLLGDFGDSTSSTSTKTTTSNGNVNDEFDPFGPSGAVQVTTNGGDSGLLVDFSVDSEVRNGDSSNGIDFEFHCTTSESGSANPLYDMSTGAQSSNPLYDLSSSNPLYEFSMGDSNQSANPLYDLTSDVTGGSEPSNPLYELEDSGDVGHGTNDDDEEEGDGQHGQYPADQQGDLLGDFETQEREEHTVLHSSIPDQYREEITVVTQEDVSDGVDQREQVGEEEEQEYNEQQYGEQAEQLQYDEQAEQQQYDEQAEQLQYDEQAEQQQYDEQAEQQQYDEQIAQTDIEETEQSGQEELVEQTEQEQSEQDQNEPEQIEQEQIETVETFPEQTEPEQLDSAEQGEQREDVVEEEQRGQFEPAIPSVEITHSPDNEDAQADETVGQEEHSQGEEADYYVATGGEHSGSAIGYHDKLTPPENYGHDRREEDLENYCMDREESDLMEDVQDSADSHSSLKPREERSRSPSRSIGPDIQDESDLSEEADTLRPRGDRSHAPSRSLEPEVRPDIPPPEEEEIIQDGRTVSRTTRTENRYSDSGFTQSSQWEEQRSEQNERPAEQDIVHFSEMSSVKNKFESQAPAPERKQVDIIQEVMSSEGGVYESQPQSFQQWQNEEEEEEGVYESTPVKRSDVAREADKDPTADLPPVGTAQSIRAKLLAGTSQDSMPKKREVTPPAHGAGGEYVSEPRGHIEKYEGKPESGVFESQPVANPDVVTSSTTLEDARPEQGFAKNVAAKFKELESKSGSYSPSNKRELTPDRSGRIEYVSEPRGHVERYEGKSESGVFESQPAFNPDVVRSGEEVREELPERGTAKNIAQKFRQISSEPTTSSASRGKRELTPDKSGRVEYVSEPRSQMETYEVKVDSGVFENQPQRNPDIVTSETSTEEFLPERGFAKNVAAKFKVLESSAKSPPLSPGRRKEFTPPREEERAKQAVVLENNPDFKSEIIHSGDQLEEKLPERGTAKNLAQRFKQLESESKSPSVPRQKKEFTPPPGDAGVYENQPKQFHADYNRPAESGILENTPIVRDDVIKATEPVRYEEELPERGTARNMVNKWRQLETEGVAKAKSPGSSGRPKEFTPPREEPRIAQQRNPKSPRTPLSPSGYDQLDNGSVHPSDLPGQYQPLNAPSVFESTPEVRNDTIKEADTDWTEGMPKKDTAKKMLAKFQHIQEEAKKQSPLPVSRKEELQTLEPKRKTPRKDSIYSESSETESDHLMENIENEALSGDKVGRSKSMRAAIQTEKCGACDKTVYAMERLEMNKRVYHKACFRCTQCKAVLTPKTFAINNEVIFCTNHYKQLFATKGNYDEGFGRMQHKKRWSSNPNLHEKDGQEEENHAIKS